MQSPTQLGSEQRAQVDRALIDLCFESGFTGLSVEALCRRAGLDRTAFDRQYTDLEDCFCQMLESERDRFFAYLDRALIGQQRWVDRLRAVAYALLRYLRADERRTHVLTIELYRVGERATLIWSETIAKRLFGLIDEGRFELADPDSLTVTTAVSVGGGIFNQLYPAVGRGSSLPAESEIVPQMMYAAVLPYLGAAAAARELSIPPPPEVAPP
jgi:AcrR family transcriptional regulator